MLRRLALAGMVALLVGGAACAQTPEPETPEPAQDDLFGISIEALRTRANAGDAEAQHTLGMRHFTGFGVPQDDVAAAAWHRQAEKQGHEDAQFYFGAKYANGEGVRQDYAEALVWLNRAIDNTVPSKREEYAEMRDQVQGFLDVNESKRTRAEAGDPNAQYDLARDYRFRQWCATELRRSVGLVPQSCGQCQMGRAIQRKGAGCRNSADRKAMADSYGRMS